MFGFVVDSKIGLRRRSHLVGQALYAFTLTASSSGSKDFEPSVSKFFSVRITEWMPLAPPLAAMAIRTRSTADRDLFPKM